MNEGTAEVIRVSVLLVAARRTGNSGRNMDTVKGDWTLLVVRLPDSGSAGGLRGQDLRKERSGVTSP